MKINLGIYFHKIDSTNWEQESVKFMRRGNESKQM